MKTCNHHPNYNKTCDWGVLAHSQVQEIVAI